MFSKTIALALLTVLLGASASTSTNARTATIASIGHGQAICDDGSSQGCSGRRCVSVEPWAGARTAGPTFPMPCRPIASLARNPVA
jgi:hypothetical protein